ncbi:MAG: ABC transporter permease [Thermoleophilaceae bacterium]|nr:ABC transporter permease [Thermoleophilaceae bacterium]
MSLGGLVLGQYRFERKMFWRNPSAAFFTFALPLLFFVLIASVFSTDSDELEVLVPGIAGMSIVGATFTALSYYLVQLRENGILKRVQGSPMPASAYLAGLLASAVANAFVSVLVVVAVGRLGYGMDANLDVLELLVFTTLGVIAFGGLGVAFAFVIPNADSAPAYVNAVFLPLIFISGVFYSADDLPPVLDAIARALPLKHVIDGLSGALVTGTWPAGALLVLGVWCVAGVVAALRLFRWE